MSRSLRARIGGLGLLVLLIGTIPVGVKAQVPEDGGPAVAAGNAVPTMTAHRLDEPVRVDGPLGTGLERSAVSAGGSSRRNRWRVIQQRTTLTCGCFFDDRAVYVGARLYDQAPQTIARNMVRRDRSG